MSLLQRSIAHWSKHQVADVPLDVTAEQSMAMLETRNVTYPGLEDLMPTDFPDKTVLDFGCGPGHDTIQFLLSGAERVYAVDISPKAIAMTRARARAHDVDGRLYTVLIGDKPWEPGPVDHVHTAGVIHHVTAPVKTLKQLKRCLKPNAEIRMMVYSSESDFYTRIAGGNPGKFAEMADGDAPVTKAWTYDEVVALAKAASLDAVYMGSYWHPGEITGPGLSSCWSLTR